MNRSVSVVALILGLLAVAHAASAASSTVVLEVEGMT